MSILSYVDVKQAIWDERFRELFPELKKEMESFMKNPSCACNMKLLKSIISYKDRVQKYFPTKTIVDVAPPPSKKWKVINCTIDNLEQELKKLPALPPGMHRQIAPARWEDQVTVIVYEVSM
jgi:hypothetical protein